MTAPTSRDEATQRLNRLAGSGQGSGGGLPLPDLFAAMLNEVLDSAPVDTERMTAIAAGVLAFKQQAVLATWPSGWGAFTADVLAQMESRKVIRRDGDAWAAGPKLVTGKRIEIIPPRPGIGSRSDGVTVWDREAREARSSADHAIRTFGELDAEIAQRGARRVTTARKELILESMRQLGDLRDFFPVLLDEEGNVVDGRHRREIDPDWPASRMRVPVDKRVAAAAAANRASAWSDRDWKALLDRVTEVTGRKRDAVRTLIRLALLEDANRTDRQLGQLIGCDHKTVADVKRELESAGEIPQQRAVNQYATRSDEKPDPSAVQPSRVIPEETREAIIQEEMRRLVARENTDFRGVAKQFGVGEPVVQQCIAIAKDRLRNSARQSGTAAGEQAPPPAPAPGQQSPTPKSSSVAEAWSRITARLERFRVRWQDKPPDPASELEELEALRQEIEERIRELRR